MNHLYSICLTLIAIVLCLTPTYRASAQEDLSVMNSWRSFRGSENFLYDAISREAYRVLEKRDALIANIHTRDEWEAYQSSIRKQLSEAFGPLPEATPLNARTTGTFEHHGITVEKIIFESRPGLWVTACLFKPTGFRGRLPAVFFPIGHSTRAFRHGHYQHVMLNLARKGFAVFTIDPIGQGERLQYYDEREGRGKSISGNATNEHSYICLQYLIISRTLAMVRLWDCIRGLDYLCGRDDIDPSRIGVQGISGGGTMSSYLGAMDRRIAAAAPECYITSFRRLFQSIGVQDGCQILLAQIARGLDHGDFLIARAPNPTLVITTTRDFFSIQGARETVASVKPAFQAFGKPQNIRIIEDDDIHTFAKLNQERKYAFFMEVFGVDGDYFDEPIPLIDEMMLQVTETGQTITSGSRTIYDCIRNDADEVLDGLDASRKDPAKHLKKVRDSYLFLAGINSDLPAEDLIFTGRFQREGYAIERMILDDGDIPLPGLVFVPKGDGPFSAVLYLNHFGKAADAGHGMLIEQLVGAGYLVFAPDLPGYGELRYGIPGTNDQVKGDDSVIDGVSYNLFFDAQLIGRSITGIQAEAVLRTRRYLSSRDDVRDGDIIALSRGITGPALMHAAATDESLKAAAFIETPISWESVIMHRFYDPAIGSTVVPGGLTRYDLPDILGLCSPRNILIVDPIDGDGRPAPKSLREKTALVVKALYGGEWKNFTIEVSGDEKMTRDMIIRWLENR